MGAYTYKRIILIEATCRQRTSRDDMPNQWSVEDKEVTIQHAHLVTHRNAIRACVMWCRRERHVRGLPESAMPTAIVLEVAAHGSLDVLYVSATNAHAVVVGISDAATSLQNVSHGYRKIG